MASRSHRLSAILGLTAALAAALILPSATAAPRIDPIGDVTEVASSNDIPWGVVFLPDGSALVSERDTFKVFSITQDGQKTEVGTVPNVSTTNGEGGLLGLEVAPTFATDHFVYIYHTSDSDNRVVRMKYENGGLSGYEVLLSGIRRAKYHNGGRLRFGPDGMLYIGTGDAKQEDDAQDTNSLNGKVLRIAPDGSIPADNPFGNAVWSIGHRNVQGLAFDSQGRLWEAEFGESTQDEINLITPGANYGWPACEGTVDYHGSCDNAAFTAPVRAFGPTRDFSPSGIAIVNDTVYMAFLPGKKFYTMAINGNSLDEPVEYFTGTYGRLRTVEKSPDGGLWLTTSNGDKGGEPGSRDNKILHIALT